jgi:hypothetical protein
MRFASTLQPSMPPATMRIVVEMVAGRAKAAIDASLPKRSRLPIRKRHGLRDPAWTHSLSSALFPFSGSCQSLAYPRCRR